MNADQIDAPEPRWQALLALLAVAGVYFALPRGLVIGPTWLLPALIGLLVVPTVFAHRTGRHSLNHNLGIAICLIMTAALIGSVVLLVANITNKSESAASLLRSGALLWLTNILVSALWYWRLDGGGPTARKKRGVFGSTSFVFPQMQIERDERARFEVTEWRPHFVDYLFIAFTTSSTFGPTDAPLLKPWAKLIAMIQIGISLNIVVVLISRAVGVL